MAFFITSTGIESNEIRTEINLLRNKGSEKVCIITTASVVDKEKNLHAQKTKEIFEKEGFINVEYFDIEYEDVNNLKKYDIIFINGGNPFYLLYHIKKKNVFKILEEQEKNGVIIIGASAGAVIFGEDIRYINDFNKIMGFENMNQIGLTDFKGFGLYTQKIFPHYDIFIEKKKGIEEELQQIEIKENMKIYRMNNNDGIMYNGDIIKIIKSKNM